MTHKELESYLLSFPNAWLDFPFGQGTSVYKVGRKSAGEDEKMFALIADDSKPLRVSLKCDPVLAETLREKYETLRAQASRGRRQPAVHDNLARLAQYEAEERAAEMKELEQ